MAHAVHLREVSALLTPASPLKQCIATHDVQILLGRRNALVEACGVSISQVEVRSEAVAIVLLDRCVDRVGKSRRGDGRHIQSMCEVRIALRRGEKSSRVESSRIESSRLWEGVVGVS